MSRRIIAPIGIVLVIIGLLVAALWWKDDAPTDGQRELVIASIIPLTGAGAEFGGYNREAVELFVEDYNKAIKGGRKVRHVFQDSKSTPRDGVGAAQAILLGEKPAAMQVQLSGVSMAVAPVAAENDLLLFTIAGTGGPKDACKSAFRNYPAPELTAEETARVFLDRKNDAKVAILRMNDEFGLSVAKAFRAKLDQMKVGVVADETFEKAATDFRAPVTKILGASPTVVYLVGFGNPMGRIIVQLHELGYKGEILGGPEIAFADVLGVAKQAAEGVKYLDLAFTADSKSEPTQEFVSRYREKYGRAPTAVSAVVYDGWSLILSAIDKAGTSRTEVVARSLTLVTNYPGVCGSLSVSDNRDVVYPLAPKQIRDGKAIML